MRIDKNTVIKCNNLDEVKDCFSKLEELGFNFEDDYNSEDRLIIFYSVYEKAFLNSVHFYITKDHNYIKYNYFLKLYNKQIKRKNKGLIVDKNGKVLKVEEDNCMKTLYYYDTYNKSIINTIGYFYGIPLDRDYYISKEACEKALKRKEVENKLRLLAFELNGNRDITKEEWKDYVFDKFYLQYQHYDKKIECKAFEHSQTQGTIYCLDKDFLNKAIELIGEKDLKDYLING